MNNKKTKITVFTLLLLFIGMLSFPLELRSDTYCYTDKKGTFTCVDDEGKIPSEYRNNLKVYEDKPKSPSGGEGGEAEESQSRGVEEWLEEREREKEQITQEEYERSLQTKVTIQGNAVLVPVSLGYKGTQVEVTLVLDTGAELVSIHQEIAKRLPITYSENASVRVPGGKVVNARLVKMDYIRVGPHEKTGIQVLILLHSGPSVPHDGLLGMNFLRGLEYSIDFENQVIRWKP